jgi:hypothetical protein
VFEEVQTSPNDIESRDELDFQGPLLSGAIDWILNLENTKQQELRMK